MTGNIIAAMAVLTTAAAFGAVDGDYGQITSLAKEIVKIRNGRLQRATDVRFSLPGALFTVDGPRAASDAARVEVGAKLAITQSVKAFASFDAEFSDRAHGYAGKGGVTVAW